MAVHVQSSGQQARANYCLPPPVKWNGGEISPAAEGRTMCKMQRSGLVGALALGNVGLTCRTQGGGRGVSSRGHIWPFTGVAQSAAAHPRDPQAAPAKMEIPSTIKPAKEAEKKREVGVQEATHVYVGEVAVIGPLDATYRGPYRVLVRENKKLLLEIGATRTWVSVDRLKPHVGANSPEAAQPPTRGRPRKKAP